MINISYWYIHIKKVFLKFSWVSMKAAICNATEGKKPWDPSWDMAFQAICMCPQFICWLLKKVDWLIVNIFQTCWTENIFAKQAGARSSQIYCELNTQSEHIYQHMTGYFLVEINIRSVLKEIYDLWFCNFSSIQVAV